MLIKPKSWERHGRKSWIEAAKKRLHPNVLAIALANKLARIAWGVLAHGRDFEVRKTSEFRRTQQKIGPLELVHSAVHDATTKI